MANGRRRAAALRCENAGPTAVDASPASVEEPRAQRRHRRLRAVCGCHLLEDALDVLLRRGDAPTHPLSDLSIGQTIGDRTENIELDTAQRLAWQRRGVTR